MARLPYAAKQLIEQVQERYKTAEAEPADDPDGLDVHRAIKFDARSSAWLSPILDHFEDPRIIDHRTEGKRLVVTFSEGIEADTRDEFPLRDVEAVLKED